MAIHTAQRLIILLPVERWPDAPSRESGNCRHVIFLLMAMWIESSGYAAFGKRKRSPISGSFCKLSIAAFFRAATQREQYGSSAIRVLQSEQSGSPQAEPWQ